MSEHSLALAVNGREYQLFDRLVMLSGTTEEAVETRRQTIAIVGLGYVGLPTAYALRSDQNRIVGFDVDPERLRAIRAGTVDLPESARGTIATAVEQGSIHLTDDATELSQADSVIICVPTPVDDQHTPDLSALRAACASVVAQVHSGQTIILTSTTFVGTTRELLVNPLRQRGFHLGKDLHVAFSPERIDPGNLDHSQWSTPRVVGGVTPACAHSAGRVIGGMTDSVYLVSSPESAELTKLYENIFRAVNLALANEIADVCGDLELDPIEVTIAAGTKPYGFLGSFPGPGVGGHCIPCDPYYLLWQLRQHNTTAPLLEQAMRQIADRPQRVVRRAVQLLNEAGVEAAGARVLVVGVSYKAGVRDLRESPAIPIMTGLARAGVEVSYHDPLLPEIRLSDGTSQRSVCSPDTQEWDLAVIHTVHPGVDYEWARGCRRVLDATYQFDTLAHREVV